MKGFAKRCIINFLYIRREGIRTLRLYVDVEQRGTRERGRERWREKERAATQNVENVKIKMESEVK